MNTTIHTRTIWKERGITLRFVNGMNLKRRRDDGDDDRAVLLVGQPPALSHSGCAEEEAIFGRMGRRAAAEDDITPTPYSSEIDRMKCPQNWVESTLKL